MKLLQQFPDASKQMRRLNQKSAQKQLASAIELNDSDNALQVFYDGEFRKWHKKAALIIVFIVTCLFAAFVGILRLSNG